MIISFAYLVHSLWLLGQSLYSSHNWDSVEWVRETVWTFVGRCTGVCVYHSMCVSYMSLILWLMCTMVCWSHELSYARIVYRQTHQLQGCGSGAGLCWKRPTNGCWRPCRLVLCAVFVCEFACTILAWCVLCCYDVFVMVLSVLTCLHARSRRMCLCVRAMMMCVHR